MVDNRRTQETEPNRDHGSIYDVVILGTGIAGTVLATILARHGVKLLMIDSGTHPRFAIGESTVPHTTLLLEFLAARFSVPELYHISSPELVRQHVGSSCGIKESFGYVYHREGRKQAAEEALLFGVSKYLRHYELHYFRQDIDAFLFHTAIQYGADARQNFKVTDVAFDEEGAWLTGATGERFRTRYVVDATGYRSVLAGKFNLRETPCRLRHQSRSLFTHMVGVKPYDECVEPPGAHRMVAPWSRSTLHHMFDGGWLWVIPFNNEKHSTNPLCSVGLSYDLRRHPQRGPDPQAEFDAFLSRFPEIKRQFEHARPVRPWTSTDRIQYSSTTSVGDRYCLTSHAEGFVDPYFSRGMVNTMEVTHALALRLLAAVKDGDFSARRFEFVDQLQRNMLDYNDRLVHGIYNSFCHFGLWNALVRIWAIGTIASEGRLTEALINYKRRADPAILDDFDNPPYPGYQYPYGVWFKNLFEAVMTEVDAFTSGAIQPEEATRRIFRHLKEADYRESTFQDTVMRPVLWALCDPETRCIFMHARLYLRARNLTLAREWRALRRSREPIPASEEIRARR